MVEKADGFLGRWARRKKDAQQGKPLDEPVPVAPAVAVPSATLPGTANASLVGREPAAIETPLETLPELSLDDAKLLTKDSDFKPFMASNVGAEVRNAAMKKLFSDPHFNVMDGLDIYIDDYSISEPIPESMLRQMASAKFLKLFDDEENEEATAKAASTASADATREIANNPADQTVAQSDETIDIVDTAVHQPENTSQPESAPAGQDSGAHQQDHAHTDLRLQPDDAASGPEAGRRA